MTEKNMNKPIITPSQYDRLFKFKCIVCEKTLTGTVRLKKHFDNYKDEFEHSIFITKNSNYLQMQLQFSTKNQGYQKVLKVISLTYRRINLKCL